MRHRPSRLTERPELLKLVDSVIRFAQAGTDAAH
jgi:hypothetical protein